MSNPATRLHAILHRAKVTAPAARLLKGWESALNLQAGTRDAVILRKLALTMELTTRIRQQVEQRQLYKEEELTWLDEIDGAFASMNFVSSFVHFAQKITPSTLVHLHYCGKGLAQNQTIDPEAIGELRHSAWLLYSEILHADLPEPFAQYLLDHVYAIFCALDDLEITGPEAVERAVFSFVGSAALGTEAAKGAAKTDLFKRLLEIAGGILAAMKFINEAGKLPDTIRNLLGLGDH